MEKLSTFHEIMFFDKLHPPKIALLLGGLASLLLVYTVAVVVYNIYLHPLSKFPGPKYAAANDIQWLIACTGDLIPWLHNMHQQYGEVVRIGPNRLSYISPQAWKDIYGHRKAGQRTLVKDPNFYSPEVNGEYTIATTNDVKEHSSLRRIFSHAFSDKALSQQEDLIQRYVDQLVRTIKKKISDNPNSELDLVTLYNCTTFDVMGDLAFGEPLGLLEQSSYTPWVKAVFGGIKFSTFMQLTRQYPMIGSIMKLFMPHLSEQKMMHFNHSAERVDRRLEKGNNEPDIWNLVLNREDFKLSLAKMHSNSSVFMIAGTETTATLLSGLTYFLLKNPDKLKKAMEEVRSLSSDDQLNLNTLPHLQYMAACFEEGLRCYPPVPHALPRVVPEGGSVICGKWIPPQTLVGIPQWPTYRSASNFKDPNSFIPERWLPGTGFDEDRKEALQPFLYGPRNCIGKNLAYHEMRLILAKMLWHFDMELCPQSGNWVDQKSYGLWEKPPLWAKFKLCDKIT